MKIVNFNFYKYNSENNNENDGQPKYTIVNINNNELSSLDEDQNSDAGVSLNKMNDRTKNDNEYNDFPSNYRFWNHFNE